MTRGPSPASKALLYLFIFISGVAGLTYQVVWHKYLAILLGAQARATAAVLAVFLGGMALGYMVFGRLSRTKPWNLLVTFCLVELGLAVWAFAFPLFFRLSLPLVPWLCGVLGVDSLLIDVPLTLALLGVPTFLMGGTLPLLTQGLSEDLDSASTTHARIYGFNTLGACLGSLLAGYLFIPLTDLPTALGIAGALNIVVAAGFYFTFARHGTRSAGAGATSSARSYRPSLREALLLSIGFCSGFYVLTLETVLIRLMGLATGASNYTFTLIVSIFVFGLGAGSLLARRISRYTVARLFANQAIVAVLLFVLYLSGDYWSYGAHLIRIIFRDTEQNFFIYQGFLGIALLALLSVPVGFCGFAMPLCFHLFKDRQESLGDRVGVLYGINTLGCVAGALIGGYALFHVLDLDEIFRVCILISIFSAALAVWLFTIENKTSPLHAISIGGVFTVLVTAVLLAPSYDRYRWVQPFRQQRPIDVSYKGAAAFGKHLARNTRYLFYKDGPNTSVGVGNASLKGKEDSRTLFVNGKSDGNTVGDAFTMNMTGYLPGLLAPRLDRVCIVGFGTGLTAGALLRYKETGQVDIAEIADTVIKVAPYFDKYNGGVSSHPRVRFHAMDAFRFLGGTKQKFDVIISEPSNPWVSGVENLYSAEFYEMAKSHLADNGLFVQWVQIYAFNDQLFKMVLKTLTGRFSYVTVFHLQETDIALIASQRPFGAEDILRVKARYEGNPSVKAGLASLGVPRVEVALAMELVPAPVTKLLGQGSPEHRLERPRLSQLAARAFFVNSLAKVHELRRKLPEFYPSVSGALLTHYLGGEYPSTETLETMRESFCSDGGPAENRVFCEEAVLMKKWVDPLAPMQIMRGDVLAMEDVRGLASFQPTRIKQKAFSEADLEESRRMFEIYRKYYSPIARLPLSPVLDKLNDCLEYVDRTKGLYGDCLVQKAGVLAITEPESGDFKHVLSLFREWLGTFSPQSETYLRYREALKMMESIIEDNQGV